MSKRWVKDINMSKGKTEVWHKKRHSLSVVPSGNKYSVSLHSGIRYKYQGRFDSKNSAMKMARLLMKTVK